MKRLTLSLLLVLPAVPVTHATDCSTSFDQGCLSGEYKGEAVEVDQQQRENQLQDFQRAVEEQDNLEAQQEAEEAERQHAEEIEERRHQEDLRAQKGIADAIRAPKVIIHRHLR